MNVTRSTLLAGLLLATGCGAESGVTVVNIVNGFGAGYTAALINRRIAGLAGTQHVEPSEG